MSKSKRKLQIICALTCSFGILLIGCSKESAHVGKEHDEIKKENTTLLTSNSKLEGKYEELEEQVEVLKQQVNDLNSMLEGKKEDNKQDENNEETIKLPIYIKDEDSGKLQTETNVTMRSDIALGDKFQILVDNLSKQQFNEYSIVVESVKDEHAVIRIKESTEIYEDSWSKRYLSDEKMAQWTNSCITESLLQREYKGEWIKSLRIIYEGPEDWRNGYIDNLENTYQR